jgi:hypothetical protein
MMVAAGLSSPSPRPGSLHFRWRSTLLRASAGPLYSAIAPQVIALALWGGLSNNRGAQQAMVSTYLISEA